MDARSAPDLALTPESQLTTLLEGIGEGFYFEPAGVVCTIDAPLDSVRDEHSTA